MEHIVSKLRDFSQISNHRSMSPMQKTYDSENASHLYQFRYGYGKPGPWFKIFKQANIIFTGKCSIFVQSLLDIYVSDRICLRDSKSIDWKRLPTKWFLNQSQNRGASLYGWIELFEPFVDCITASKVSFHLQSGIVNPLTAAYEKVLYHFEFTPFRQKARS